jgi:hypothetical protein
VDDQLQVGLTLPGYTKISLADTGFKMFGERPSFPSG